MVSRSRFLASLLFFVLLTCFASFAHAGEFCSTFPDPNSPGDGLIDGSDPVTVNKFVTENITQITIDTNCTFRNWPASNPLDVTLNFQTNDPSIYLIVFDNVEFTGNMACANVDHKLWFVNGSSYNFSSKCQDLFIPVEAISKKVPTGKTTVGIGEPFTYTLTIPVLYDPASGTVFDENGTDVEVHTVQITDDLNLTGADLTFVSTNVTYNGTPLLHTFNNSSGVLTYSIDPGFIIPIGEQIQIELTVVADASNAVGTQFRNTASWTFGRLIRDLDLDGDGILEDVFFTPLPGENGVSEILTIGAPDLTMTKSSPDTALSPGLVGSFTLDVQNNGSSPAWEATIVDRLPESGTASMCVTDPTTLSPVTAAIYQADGTTLVNSLTAGVDYTISFTGSPTCELTLVMTGNNSVIDVGQRLIINYQARLEPGATVNGEVLTNVAGVTQWFSGDSSYPRTTFSETLSDGTPADATDHEDSFDVTVGLAGYYFQKTVANLDSGANPATIAQAGDTLRYRLRIFNVNQNVNNVAITDQLDLSRFDAASFSLVSAPAAATVSFSGSGLLTIDGGAGSLDVAQGAELIVEFDIDTLTTLVNNDVVSNQALLSSTSGNDVESDDPYVNGVDDPQDAVDDADPTEVVIQQPGSLLKTNGPASAVIGDTFTYTITVPEVPVATPLYDVRIVDTLGVDSSGTATVAGVSFVDAVDGGNTWNLTNTGTNSSPVIEDLTSGIDIPAGSQAVITMTVVLDNTIINQAGVQFYNTASYTYNRTNGVPSTRTTGGSVVTTSPTTIYEPGIATFTKTADNTTPTAGDVVRYTVTMTAQSGANTSDVFDVILIDNLDLGLAYVANSATVSTGAGVGADNALLSTDVTGDGISTPQTLIWGVANVDLDIQAGDTVTLEYEVQVLNNVVANTVLNNSVIAQWTSTDGANGLERDGSDGAGGLNDYVTPVVTETLTSPDIAAIIIKERFTDTFDVNDNNVRIGDIVYYTLTIPMPEGTLGNLQLVDALPQGLDFEGIVSIGGDTTSPYNATAPFAYADIPDTDIVEAGDPTIGPTTVTFTLGNVTNTPDDGLPNNFTVVYSARVVDNVFAQVDNTPLNNTVVMTYDTATNTVTASDIDTIIDVLQPNLSVTKAAAPAGGDTLINAGEVVTYTVDIINNGTAPAYDTVLQDVLPQGLRQAGVTTSSITRVTTATNTVTATLAGLAPSYDVSSGTATWNFDTGAADDYTIPVGETLRIVYEVQADAGISLGLTLTNAATATLYYSFDDDAVPTLGGVAGTREIYGPSNTASTTLYTAGSQPTKALIAPAPASPLAAIGETVVYEITVPGTVSGSTLYDVQITDTLDTNLQFVSANVTGGIGVTDNSTSAPGVMDIAINEIPAGTQVVIELTARLNNVLTAQQGVQIDNTVDYSYAFTSGGTTQPPLTSINSVTVDIVEPDLTVSKAVTTITPAPITGGDILEYVLTIPNNGNATAFDVNIVDTLPTGLSLDTGFTPTAAIDAVPVAGFIAAPSGAPGGPLVWGRNNADASLDIPAGSTLVLTYRVLIDASVEANVTLTNSVVADWTSLDGVSVAERDGSDGAGGLNDYVTPAATSDTVTADNNSLSKAVIADSYAPANDSTVRVGDTVTYQLSLNLQEGTTNNVAVNDVLDAGLEFAGIVSINGDTAADYTPPGTGAGSNFSYTAITAGALPVSGQTGTLTFSLGSVTNDPLGDATTDTLTIVYQARVAENTIAQAPSTTLTNTATLSYTDGNGTPVVNPARLEDTASVTVLQPVMTVPTKVDAVFSSGAVVNVATDTMQFTLESCNTTGLASAYDLQLTDVLASQLNEGSLTTPIVQIYDAPSGSGGNLLATLADGVGYNYTAPAGRGGSIVIDMIDAVAPGNCVTVSYAIGFYTDFGPNEVWNNSVTVDEYWSLPSASGQLYTPLGPTIFVMTNGASPIDPPAKVMTVPASGEATVGEQVVYQITVPGTMPNSALYDVVITDVLHASLEYISAVDISGNGFTLTDNTNGNNVSLAIAQIPAGQQAVIELTARVANNANANAGTSFTNTASYSFANSAGGTVIPGGNSTTATSLLIVEPTIGINKAVANTSTVNPADPPTAGNILRYTVTLTASGGTAGDNFSDAFDATIIDNLSLGLAYVAGSATVDGGNTINDPAIAGDGVTTPQSMTWQLADASADIDIAEGATVTVSYDVTVLNGVLANQALSNSAAAQWTGLDGIDANERTGAGTPAVNDYFTTPVTTTVTTPDTTSLAKSRLTDTFGAADTDVRIGDIVEYQVAVVLPEGQSNNVVITDTLPTGMAFEEIAQINGDATAPFSSVAPFTYSDITPVVSGNPATGPSTVTFNLGDVVNAGDNNPANDTFIIVYRVRLLDNVFSQVNSTSLANAVQLVYTNASGQQTQTDSVDVTLLQPQLTVAKTASTAGGDTVIESGEIITYTVAVTNNGAAPAYDVVVEDTIPVGLRQAGVTTNSITLSSPAEDPADFNPVYVAATGVATWNFDDGTSADTYTIDPGQTLVIVYQVQADAGLGAGVTLTNLAVASVYYSLDDDAIPNLGGATGVPEIYGPSNTDSTTLTTASPGALLKQTPFELTAVPDDQTVTIGETFTYRITVPETPLPLALHDVRILDNLTTSAAVLSYVSVSKVAAAPGINSQPWTPVNSGSLTNLIIEDPAGGIDIPAGEQVVIDVTVQVVDAAANISGLVFTNDATYTYNQLPDDPGTQQPGLPDTSGDMIIIAPDSLTMVKTGPATMRVGIPETFTLTVHNDNTSGNAAPAWDLTVTDVLPNAGTGGMCDTAPVNISAGIYQDNAGTVLVTALANGADYTTSYSGCTLTVTMQSANAMLPVDNYLIVSYDAELDADTPPNSTLTNIAGATQWFSNDTAGTGATGETRTFTEVLTNGTVGVLDHEDAHTLSTEAPVITFEKTVFNLTTGQPGTSASPGDTLQYTIQIENISDVDLPDFTFIDEVDALNAIPAFAAGTLAVTNAGGGIDVSNPAGGANGTGLVTITNLALAPQTSPPNNQVTIIFTVTLAAVIDSGTVVLNQGAIQAPGVSQVSDDPNIAGATDPTPTTITAAPVFQVQKTSQDLTGDPAVLLSGDTLRYTITVKNIGNENAINVTLTDTLPANTSYVPGSTTLNGMPVADTAGGVLPLINGIAINAPENTTPGYMRADASATTTNVATIVFDVVINSNIVNGTVISNQAYVDAQGAGSGVQPQQPSDDPTTTAVDDPTIDVVGNLPLVDAHKTVSIVVDNGSPGIVDPGDQLRYNITITNVGATPATGVIFIDGVPVNTTYIPDSVTLNGIPVGVPDGGVSPLVSGIDVSSSDLTPPLPATGNGTVSAGGIAVITFDVEVNGGVAAGTIISNQGSVDSDQLPVELTDADGIDSNGDQPTDIAVGNAQLLSITKQVAVVGGGSALAGGLLEYRVRVTNTGSIAATNVVITDNLDLPVAAQLTYVAGSGLLNGLPAGVSFSAPVITANFASVYGDLQPGSFAELRFLAQIDSSLPIGTTITNTADVNWSSPPQTASASVSIDIGGTPGVANINGTLWVDANYNNILDSGEVTLEGWTIEVYRTSQLLGSFTTDTNGAYQFNGLLPNDIGTDLYEVRFTAPGAGPNTAKLGMADSSYSNDLHRVFDIVVSSGGNVENLNLPIDPNGVVYDAILRTPVAGATLTLLNASNGNQPVPASCLDDPAQQNQVTLAGGYYKFDVNFSDPACSSGDTFVIEVMPPANGYVGTTSLIIPPALALTDAPFSVPSCPGSVDDQLSTSPDYCEIQASVFAPSTSVLPNTAGTSYYMQFTLSDSVDPYTRQIFNNHIPVDPELGDAVAISKTSGLINVTRGQLVPYTITINNSLGVPLPYLDVVDNFPAGFKYVSDSAHVDGVATEPVINGLQMTWPSLTLNAGEIKTIKMLLVVGGGVSEGEYVNRVQAINSQNGEPLSAQATATVRVIPDPSFDCSDVIGKVFDDRNMNGYQDEGEPGIPSARVVSARGIEVKTDAYGRFHITCAVVPNEDRGSNFILKLDDRSLPSGYRLTTENPRVQRATRGKMLKFNFGAVIHRVVRLDMADAVFEPGSTRMRSQWLSRISLLMEKLVEAPSVLRLSYLADTEDASLVEERLQKVKDDIEQRWENLDCCYRLEIETEVFWRRGKPASGDVFDD